MRSAMNETPSLPFRSNCADDTEAFAAAMARSLPKGTVIALHGDLGAGKTVFARGFARGLGVQEPVSSPTFTLVQEYPFSGGILYHLDLYRINDSAAALAFGVDEFLYDKSAFALVEWPERVADILPPETIHLKLTPLEAEGARRIERLG